VLRLAPRGELLSARARQCISSAQVARSSARRGEVQAPAALLEQRDLERSASFLSCSETVGWARCSSSAARVTLPRRATASKTMSWGNSPWRKETARSARHPGSFSVTEVWLAALGLAAEGDRGKQTAFPGLTTTPLRSYSPAERPL
jgi:hypothetical protein